MRLLLVGRSGGECARLVCEIQRQSAARGVLAPLLADSKGLWESPFAESIVRASGNHQESSPTSRLGAEESKRLIL
jgi:hypothetical protein